MNLPAHHAVLSLIVAITAIAALWDLRTGLIPNWLVASAASLGVCANMLLGFSYGGGPGLWSGFLQALFGVLGTALIPLALYLARGLAGGDVKLLMAIGALGGPVFGLETQLYAFVLGALFVCGMLAYQGNLLRTVLASFRLVALAPFPARRACLEPELLRVSVRFGPAIWAGSALAAFNHWSVS